MSDDEQSVEEYVYSDEEYYDEAPESQAALSRNSSTGTGGGGGGAALGGTLSSGGAAGGAGGVAGSGSSSTAAAAAVRGTLASAGEMDYRVLASHELQKEQSRIIKEVSSLLAITAEAASILLLHYKYNKERLIDAFMADGSGVRARTGIEHSGKAGPAKADFFCSICLNDCPAAGGYSLGCGHPFCRGCWKSFLSTAIASQGQGCILSSCPEDGCRETVSLTDVQALGAPEVVDKWTKFGLQQFVNLNKNMAWCPNANCSNAFVSRGVAKTVACSCGMKFCFKCSKEAHEPASCDSLERWLLKCGNESETANWILANTKKCPLCSVRIEKNQGCNHMVCRNKGCKHEFCWVCLQPWTEHGQTTGGFYKCNKFKEAALADDSAAGRAKAELDRYLFYYQRYSNHDLAGKFAAKHRDSTQRRMAEMQAGKGLSYADVTYLNDATEVLLECRRVLKNTYVYAFYFTGEASEKTLFEHLQQQLEQSTEHLAELTEKPIDDMDRTEVVNFTRVTMQFLRNLLVGIEDGLTSG